MEDYNPRLRAAYLDAVDAQLKSGEPPETKGTYERLKREGFSDEEARVLLAQVIAVESYCIVKERKPFNRERFVRNLNALPAEPHE
jgi:hypothetical protein